MIPKDFETAFVRVMNNKSSYSDWLLFDSYGKDSNTLEWVIELLKKYKVKNLKGEKYWWQKQLNLKKTEASMKETYKIYNTVTDEDFNVKKELYVGDVDLDINITEKGVVRKLRLEGFLQNKPYSVDIDDDAIRIICQRTNRPLFVLYKEDAKAACKIKGGNSMEVTSRKKGKLSPLQKKFRKFFRGLLKDYDVKSPKELETKILKSKFFAEVRDKWAPNKAPVAAAVAEVVEALYDRGRDDIADEVIAKFSE